MSPTQLEVLGGIMAALGWIFAAVSCALPTWKVSVPTGTVMTTLTHWNGPWMDCIVDISEQIICKIHDTMMDLDGHIQAARALTILSIVVGALGILAAMMGSKYTLCMEEESAKAQMMRIAGVAFVLASLTQLIPVSWYAHTIITDFHNPHKEWIGELGAAIYMGWAAAALLLIGGILCCTSCSQPEKSHRPPSNTIYSQTRSNAASGYNRKDFV